MSDEAPKRRRKKPDTKSTVDDGAGREAVVAWMRQQIEAVEKDAQMRVELAQTEVMHPSPIYQRLVKHYASAGFKPALICQLLMMQPVTLKTYYSEELTIGPALINLKMAETLMTIGFDPMHPQAASVAMKWLERMHPDDAFKPPAQQLKVEEKNEKRVIDSSSLTPEQREQVRQIILSAGDEPTEEPDNGEQGT
jgi:hypothetical protein